LPLLRPQRGQTETPRKHYSTYRTSPDEQQSISVPRLVSDELFEAAAERLEENRRRNRQGRRGAKHLLQGLLECQCCGYSYYGKPVSRSSAKGKVRHYAYYRCIGTDAYRFGGERVCDNKQVRTDVLEEAVWQDVCSLLHDPQRVSEEFERRLNREEPSVVAVQQLESQLQKVRRAITRLIDAYEDGLLNKSEFEPRIKSSKERLAKLESESSRLSEAQSEESELRLAIGHLEDFSKHVRDGLETIDWTDKREIIRALVKRVEIGREEVRVVYKVSPPPFVQGPASGASLQDCLRRDFAAAGEHLPQSAGSLAGSGRFCHRAIRRRLCDPVQDSRGRRECFGGSTKLGRDQRPDAASDEDEDCGRSGKELRLLGLLVSREAPLSTGEELKETKGLDS
jgi:site-specific DNA recombinase